MAALFLSRCIFLSVFYCKCFRPVVDVRPRAFALWFLITSSCHFAVFCWIVFVYLWLLCWNHPLWSGPDPFKPVFQFQTCSVSSQIQKGHLYLQYNTPKSQKHLHLWKGSLVVHFIKIYIFVPIAMGVFSFYYYGKCFVLEIYVRNMEIKKQLNF